jgi:hypothetical protein
MIGGLAGGGGGGSEAGTLERLLAVLIDPAATAARLAELRAAEAALVQRRTELGDMEARRAELEAEYVARRAALEAEFEARLDKLRRAIAQD